MHAIDEPKIATMETKQPLIACLLIAPNQAERRHNPSCSAGRGGTGVERHAQLERHGRKPKPCALLQRQVGSKFPHADASETAATLLWMGQVATMLRKVARKAKRLGAGKA